VFNNKEGIIIELADSQKEAIVSIELLRFDEVIIKVINLELEFQIIFY
jgi:hypothetical protein